MHDQYIFKIVGKKNGWFHRKDIISKRRIQVGQAKYSCLWNYLIPLVWVGISLFQTKGDYPYRS